MEHVEHKGAKRRRTGNGKERRHGRKHYRNDECQEQISDASVEATNRARDNARGAVAATEDDDEEEVTADFRGVNNRHNNSNAYVHEERVHVPRVHGNVSRRQFITNGAPPHPNHVPMYLQQPDGSRLSFGNFFQFGRGMENVPQPQHPMNQTLQPLPPPPAAAAAALHDRVAPGPPPPASHHAAFFPGGDAVAAPAMQQGPIAMTAAQIRNVQFRTFNLLMDFWAGRRGQDEIERKRAEFERKRAVSTSQPHRTQADHRHRTHLPHHTGEALNYNNNNVDVHDRPQQNPIFYNLVAHEGGNHTTNLQDMQQHGNANNHIMDESGMNPPDRE